MCKNKTKGKYLLVYVSGFHYDNKWLCHVSHWFVPLPQCDAHTVTSVFCRDTVTITVLPGGNEWNSEEIEAALTGSSPHQKGTGERFGPSHEQTTSFLFCSSQLLATWMSMSRTTISWWQKLCWCNHDNSDIEAWKSLPWCIFHLVLLWKGSDSCLSGLPTHMPNGWHTIPSRKPYSHPRIRHLHFVDEGLIARKVKV